ncbi:MAG: hypothetical protein ACK5KU_04420 [Beutenbergiaceae bacterium]
MFDRLSPLRLLLFAAMVAAFALANPPPADAAETRHPDLRLSARATIGQGWSGDIVMPASDLTGDFRADILAIRSDGDLMLYPARSATGYRSPIQVGQGWHSQFVDFSTVDLTGDGVGDLLTQHRDGRMLLYPNRGSGRFGAAVPLGHGWSVMRDWVVLPHGPYGRPAIFAIHDNGGLYRYETTGAGNILAGTRIGGGWSGVASIHDGGDVDRNGVSDLLALTRSGMLNIYVGRMDSSRMVDFRLGHGFSGYSEIAVITEPSGATHLRGVDPSGYLMNWRLSYLGGNAASGWGNHLITARQLAGQYGCGNARIVTAGTPAGASGAAAPWYWTIFIRPDLGSRLNYVVAHECAHLQQYRAYGLTYSGWYEMVADTNRVYGGSGYSGLEQNADCVSRYWGVSGSYYTTSCSSARGTAAMRIATGREID